MNVAYLPSEFTAIHAKKTKDRARDRCAEHAEREQVFSGIMKEWEDAARIRRA